MKSEWLPYIVLRAASLLAPGDQRAEWLKGWQSELWYIPRRGATLFCLGAFRDALWLKRNNLSPPKRNGMHLESPLCCLAFLAMLAAVSSLIAVCLPGPQLGPRASHLSGRDLREGWIGMLMLSGLSLPAIRLAMGSPANHYQMPWPSRLRRGIFMALKIALLQPILFFGFVVMLEARALPMAPLWFGASSIFALRWVFTDRRRCPVCLRLLTDPVRIGAPSQTFLEWWRRVDVLARSWSAAYSGDDGQLLRQTAVAQAG